MDIRDIYRTVDDIEIKNPLLWTRPEIHDRISRHRRFDIVVIGGGIHGAAVARLAAFNGLTTLLLEKSDYASATSSRSSKMAHGGLRYLGMYDFRQVFEGIKAREDLFEVAPHLVRPHQFHLPVPAGRPFERLRLKLGLSLYDWFVQKPERRHHWVKAADARQMSGAPLAGMYAYTDGIMRDSRLVIENILAARQEGALCLNYAQVDSFSQRNDGSVVVGWRDVLSGKSLQSTAGIVLNCAGPWAPHIGKLRPHAQAPKVRYSQGIHLLFNQPWRGPALFIPLGPPNQYYFVWPHPAGTMVGTTEREVFTLDEDPVPTRAEVREVLQRIARDLPDAGLTAETLHYCFAGVRTLPLRAGKSSTVQISRRHEWRYNAGVLTLYGGKYTTAQWTALEGLRAVFQLAENHREIQPVRGRPMPGAARFMLAAEEFRTKMSGHADQTVIENAIARLGGRVSDLLEDDGIPKALGGVLFREEIEQALQVEQAESIEDLMRRRMEIEAFPGHGLAIIDQVAEILSQHRPDLDVASQVAAYRSRMTAIASLLKSASSPD